MGVILIHRVVGMDQGDVQLLGDAAGQEEGGELTLGVDHVRMPVNQLANPLSGQGRAQTGTGVHKARGNGAEIRHAVLFPGAAALGEGQHPDLVAPPLQLSPKIFHRRDHPVDGGAVPVGGNKNFHARSLSSRCSNHLYEMAV